MDRQSFDELFVHAMNSSGFLWLFACFDWCLMLVTAAHTLGALPYVLFLVGPLILRLLVNAWKEFLQC